MPIPRLPAAVGLLGALLSLNLLADIRPPVLALPKGVDAGEQLLGALGCADCHQAPPAAQVRLMPRTGPRLGGDSPKLTPQFLRAWLQDPQASKPGSTMPDLLHGLPVMEKAEAIEDLTHFLLSIQGADTNGPVAGDQFKMGLGKKLYHEVGCVACHAPVEGPEGVAPAEVAALAGRSIPLGDLARKTTVPELARFLRDPAKARPNGRMPSLNLTPREAEAIAMYLLRAQAAGFDDLSKAQKFPGVRFQYFEGNFDDEGEFDRVTPKNSGVADDFRLRPRGQEDNVGFRYTGLIRVTEPGEYRFYTRSDDGSRLRVDAALVVDNWGVHATTEKAGTVTLKAGDHPFQLTWYNGAGETSLEVLWEGPGIAKQRIPKTALFQMSVPMEPIGALSLAIDPARVDRGRERFANLGCASCHQASDRNGLIASRATAKPLSDLKAHPDQGCLATTVPSASPRYALSAEQRTALVAVVRSAESLSLPLDPASQVSHTLARLNCLVCHSRDGQGGPEAAGRSAWFSVAGEADLGDEGRIPPHLTKVGGKLRQAWLAEILQKGTKTRPYMATRMPVFGEAHVAGLPALFEKVDSDGPPPVEPAYAAREMKAGWKLVGADGLSCIACHTFGPHKSLGIPAMDLTQMSRRLRPDWFRKYVVDPAALRPGTRMPTFWPEGKAANRDILDGNTAAQVNAIWAFLSRGGQADVPSGLIRAKKEIVVTNEPVIYRNFIDGAGSRAIAVGYPERAHLAFDANDSRLALLWQGSFIDMSRHSTDRGVGYEPPLGDHRLSLPAGAPFAVLADPTAPWPKEAGRSAGWSFRGYSLDGKRRPTFRYQFGALEFQDFPQPQVVDFDVSLSRQIVIRGNPGGTLWFRAAVGEIKSLPGGIWQVDSDLKLSFRGGGTPVIAGNELRVPMMFQAGEATLIEIFSW